MTSDAKGLNFRERLRWGDGTKVYTRKKRRIQKKDNSNNDVSPATTAAAAVEAATAVDVAVSDTNVFHEKSKLYENNNVSQPISQTLEADGHGSCGGAAVSDGGDGGDTMEVNREVAPEGSCGGLPNHEEGSEPREDLEVANRLVKPVISRLEDRVRISLTGARSGIEIRDLRRTLERELDHVRSFAKKLEAKEFQLTSRNIGNNGSVVAVPGDAVVSHSYPQYMGSDNLINGRSLVRVHSEVGSVGHIQPRPFRPPRLAVVVNNHTVGELVEKEKRTPKANPYYKNSEFLLGKDRLPSESNKKLKTNGSGSVSKYGFAFGFGTFDKHRKQLFRSCSDLLQRLMKHKHGWVFNEPVNVEALGLHDYHDIIKHPMDLGTIKNRLSQNWYKSPKEFAEDIRLVFSNAMTYNPKGQDVHVMAEQLSQIFEERWAAIEAKYNPGWRYQMYHDAGLPTPTSRRAHLPHPFVHEPVPYHTLAHSPRARTLERSGSITGAADANKKPFIFSHVGRTPVPKKPKAKDPNKRDMTYEEKQKLSTNLENLPSEKLDAIVQIIKKRSTALNQNNDEIEVDIDSVDAETLWELDRFVTNYKKSLSKNKRKAELALQARARAAQSAPAASSGPMVADALKESRPGEMHTSAPSTNAEGGRPVDNASSSSSSSSSSSDSGSSSSDSDSDSSSTYGSDAGH
ncbi:transcription factor GTE4 [Nicotiana tabacum]|uniref:Transcription factor GTE4 n=1 Tax=Nicotiana tabacum TaxID=4097 RepID=A0A1S3ZWA3_TOBAC